MDDFNWESFTRKIAVKADLETLYNAWTIPEEIEKWFLSKAKYTDAKGTSVEHTSNVNQGDEYEWSWYLFDVIEKGKVTKANGVDHFQFTFAGDCLVDIELSEQEDCVVVQLTQSNIPTDNRSKKNIRLGCDSGWSFFLVNLKSVYEGGIDLRNKNEALKGMLNN